MAKDLLPLPSAWDLIAREVKPLGAEAVDLEAALHRVLAQNAVAERDLPPFHRATMDGYAIRSAEFTDGSRSFPDAGFLPAGGEPRDRVPAGAALRIMTGAGVPPELDAVIRIEDCVVEGGAVRFTCDPPRPFANIARRGEDLAKGAVVAAAGRRLRAMDLGALASCGVLRPRVARLPRVSILSTGDEVAEGEGPVSSFQIRDSNRYTLQAHLGAHWAIHGPRLERRADRRDDLLDYFQSQGDRDLVLTSGAVSAGDLDFIPDLAQAAGYRRVFHGVAIKPGKPVFFGLREDGGVLLALPGNPYAVQAACALFVDRVMAAFSGMMPEPWAAFALSGARTAKTPFDEFFPVTDTSEGRVQGVPWNGSGDVRALVSATGIARHPAGKKGLEAGEIIPVYRFDS
ncbi:MAG: molybdopterin molybdotransferase MoeA [Spirochaetes bacterium]|nr:molybdopterin molybdotransferase MoeA [Spirochaetota bacterium]